MLRLDRTEALPTQLDKISRIIAKNNFTMYNFTLQFYSFIHSLSQNVIQIVFSNTHVIVVILFFFFFSGCTSVTMCQSIV